MCFGMESWIYESTGFVYFTLKFALQGAAKAINLSHRTIYGIRNNGFVIPRHPKTTQKKERLYFLVTHLPSHSKSGLSSHNFRSYA
jgi:hypothetical protein